jgi:hypothetical protein
MSFVLSILAMVAGGITVLYAVLRLSRLHQESRIHQLRVLPEQVLSFAAPGSYDLHIEGPWFNTAFAGVQFSLRDRASGREAGSMPILFRMKRSNLARTSLSVRRFRVETPGEYVLSIAGLSPGADTSRLGLAFARPYAARAGFLTILAVLGGALFLVSLLLMPAVLTELRGGS